MSENLNTQLTTASKNMEFLMLEHRKMTNDLTGLYELTIRYIEALKDNAKDAQTCFDYYVTQLEKVTDGVDEVQGHFYASVAHMLKTAETCKLLK